MGYCGLLCAHPHSHIVLPLGGLTASGQWVEFTDPHELIDSAQLAERFRKAYLDGLRRYSRSGQLVLPESVATHGDIEAAFDDWLTPAADKSWVVNVQTPPPHCEGAEAALKYLAGYVNGSPIGNSRIVDVTCDHVTFTWKDYRNGGAPATETTSGEEFVRRFLIHILPPRFRRVRHRGFLANAVRTERIAHIRTVLGVPAEPPEPEDEPSAEGAEGDDATDTEGDSAMKPPRCPHCGAEEMIWQAELLPEVGWVAARYGDFAKRAQGTGLGVRAARPP